MCQVSETAKLIAEGVASGSLQTVSKEDLDSFLPQSPTFRIELSHTIKVLAGDERYSSRTSDELKRIADIVFEPIPESDDFPPKLRVMPSLNGLDEKQLLQQRDLALQDVQDRSAWRDQEALLMHDKTLWRIFDQLDELEYERLPSIENALAARRDAVERAA